MGLLLHMASYLSEGSPEVLQYQGIPKTGESLHEDVPRIVSPLMEQQIMDQNHLTVFSLLGRAILNFEVTFIELIRL